MNGFEDGECVRCVSFIYMCPIATPISIFLIKEATYYASAQWYDIIYSAREAPHCTILHFEQLKS